MVVLFTAMAAASPTLDASEASLLFVLGSLQIAGPKLPFLRSPWGKVLWIALELIFAYLLIGYTGGIVSNYYLILLLPMISAATYLGLVGSLLFTLLSCGSYISFVRFVDFSLYSIDPDQVRVLAMRMIFVAVAGNLVNVLAEALRVQSANYLRAAEELEEANRHLREAEAAVRRSERLAALG
jgi:K+-sensing histidine kinase KdpD